jgi:hypothetical protein
VYLQQTQRPCALVIPKYKRVNRDLINDMLMLAEQRTKRCQCSATSGWQGATARFVASNLRSKLTSGFMMISIWPPVNPGFPALSAAALRVSMARICFLFMARYQLILAVRVDPKVLESSLCARSSLPWVCVQESRYEVLDSVEHSPLISTA